MVTIRYWKKESIDYTTNGDYILNPISVKYDTGNINEGETLSVVLQIDETDNYDYVTEGGVISSPTLYDHKEGTKGQLFRVKDKDIDDNDMTMTLACKLKSTDDLCNNYIYDYYNEDVMILDTGDAYGHEALKKLQNNIQFKYDKTRKYEFYTDITTVSSKAKWEKKTVIDALVSSDENSFINRWGGELFCKDNKIYLNRKIGDDYGVEILYGKNIESMKYNVNINSLITRIIPYGYDNIKLGGKTPWVDSPNVNCWYTPITVDRTYDSVKLKDGNSGTENEGFDTIEQCREELKRLAKEEFKKTKCDQPIVNIKIDMAQVRNTIEYKELGLDKLEEVQKGDIVTCKHYLLGIKTQARVVKAIYDVLEDEIESVEIGDVTKSFFDKQATVAQQLSEILGTGNTVKGDKIAGIINSLDATFRGQRNAAQPQQVRGMLYEDDIEGSPTYGACCIGTKGLEIANKKKPDGRDWDWNTFITAGLVYSEWLVGNLRSVLIKSLNGTSYWNLKTNDLYLDEGKIHGKNFDLNMATGEINISGNATMTGAGLSLNFNTGYIYSKHGKFGNDATYYDLDSQVLHGSNIDINLKTGYVKMQQGKIGNDSCYFDISNQRIHGDRVDINLKDGTNNLLQAGTVGSVNGRTNLNLNDGTAKIGNFSVGSDNKVQVSDGSFTAKEGDKYCKVEAAKISWENGSRLENNRAHTVKTIAGVSKTLHSLDLIGNTEDGVTLSSKGAESIVNANNDCVIISHGDSELFLGKNWILGRPWASPYTYISSNGGDINVGGSNFNVFANLKVQDGYSKDCVVKSDTYGEVDYHCTEDINYILSYTPIDDYYETKKSQNDYYYYSTAIRIPKIVQETMRTDMDYNVYIQNYAFEDGRVSLGTCCIKSRHKDYFVVVSDKPIRFKYKLEARRNKLEGSDIKKQLYEFNKPILSHKNISKLQTIASRQWQKYGECFEG